MKKVLLSLLALLFVFTLVGCGKKEEAKKEDAKTETKEAAKKGCNGPMSAVYEGEYNATEGMFTIHEVVTLTLNEDGTFEAVYKDSEGYSGTYTLEESRLKTTITDGMNISVIEYIVKDDCSEITWGEVGNYQYQIHKK